MNDVFDVGLSEGISEPYSAESLAGIVSEGIEQLVPGAAPFDLLGFSFGGILSGHIAYMQASRIRSASIVGSRVSGFMVRSQGNRKGAGNSPLLPQRGRRPRN